MTNNKKTINKEGSQFRKRILEYAITVESFDMHDIYNWWFDGWPKQVPPKNKLQAMLAKINCLEKLGPQKSRCRRNMKYKLRDDWDE
jgi:hypothetical protein